MKNMAPYPQIPMTPVAMMDVWKLGIMAYELWSTSFATIAMRNNLWQTQPPNSARMLKENQRMVTEKLEAGMETGFEIQKAMLQMAFGNTSTPWWDTSKRAMTPYHRRSSANSKRLSRK